jgi:hypothetical protein
MIDDDGRADVMNQSTMTTSDDCNGLLFHVTNELVGTNGKVVAVLCCQCRSSELKAERFVVMFVFSRDKTTSERHRLECRSHTHFLDDDQTF